jgi:hypothetical protein
MNRRHAGATRRTLPAMLAGAMVAAAGCASPKVYVQSAGAEPECSSFNWQEQKGATSSLTDRQVRSEALHVLQEKGYALEETTPDCRIAYALHTDVKRGSGASIGLGTGTFGGHIGGGIGVSVPVGSRSEAVGNLSLDVIDVASNAAIWSGSLEEAVSEQPSDEEISAAVRRILERFPDRAASAP